MEQRSDTQEQEEVNDYAQECRETDEEPSQKLVKHLINALNNVPGEPWIQAGTISSVGDAIACYTLFDYNTKLVMKFLYSSVIVC